LRRAQCGVAKSSLFTEDSWHSLPRKISTSRNALVDWQIPFGFANPKEQIVK
jgi:hypothetical protein